MLFKRLLWLQVFSVGKRLCQGPVQPGPWSHRVPPAWPDWRCLNGCRWSCSSSWTGCRCARCTSPWTASRTTPSCSPTWALFPPSPGAPTGAQLHLTPHLHPHPPGNTPLFSCVGHQVQSNSWKMLLANSFRWKCSVDCSFFLPIVLGLGNILT